MIQDDIEKLPGIEVEDDDGLELPSGIKGLWISVIARAWQERRWDYFVDRRTTFRLAADCVGLSVSAVRARAQRKKDRKRCQTISTDILSE